MMELASLVRLRLLFFESRFQLPTASSRDFNGENKF